MTKAQHTPGIWSVDPNETNMVFSDNGMRIADCYCEGQEMPIEEDEANARLIAAAPELLEELKESTADMVDAYEHLEAAGVQGIDGFFQQIERNRAAIAKAEGN